MRTKEIQPLEFSVFLLLDLMALYRAKWECYNRQIQWYKVKTNKTTWLSSWQPTILDEQTETKCLKELELNFCIQFAIINFSESYDN